MLLLKIMTSFFVGSPFRFFRQISLLLSFALLMSLVVKADQPTEVYRWDAAHWLSDYNQAQFTATSITNPDGTTGAQITVTPRDAMNPYNHIVVSNAGLIGGNEYTAILTFSVVEPTKYPTSFYMFARNSVGNQYDIFRTFIGLPGPTRTLVLPLPLKAVDGGTWKIYMGISKSGGLNINSLVIYSGMTSDGKTSYVRKEPTANGTPASTLPNGVTEATGYTPFTIAPPATPTTTISLATYNFVADQPGAPMTVAVSNAQALQQAFNDCKGKGPTKLIIPKGTYRFCPTNTIAVDGLTDFTFDGQGSILILEKIPKEGATFTVGNCTRTSLQNFFLDWDWNVIPIASLGTVSNISADKLQCDFTFPDLNATQTELTRTTHWRAIAEMDPVHLIITGHGGFSLPKTATITAGSASNVLHITSPTPVTFEDGKSYMIRHLYYDGGGFKVVSCSDLTFNGVNIYSIPGMGWFFEAAMHNFQLLNCKICRAPGSRTPLTTAADGFHVDEFVDNLNIENCSITGCGDDSMNIHNECYEGETVVDPADPTKLTLMNCPSYQLRLVPGDSVEFDNADYSFLNNSTTPVTAQVASVTSNNKPPPQTVIQFTAPLPSGITPQSILRNAKFTSSNVRITGCDMLYSNGRGILISANNVLISNCHMHYGGTAINLESQIVQPLWTEGRGANNVLIKDNTFEDCNKNGRYNGSVIWTNADIPFGPTTTTLYNQITVEGNHFVNCSGPALSLTDCSNVLIRSNEIKLTEASEPNLYAGTIFMTHSSDLALGGNTWIDTIPSTSAYGVVYDPASTTNISTDTNALINSSSPTK